jgi:hypothetical protein
MKPAIKALLLVVVIGFFLGLILAFTTGVLEAAYPNLKQPLKILVMVIRTIFFGVALYFIISKIELIGKGKE